MSYLRLLTASSMSAVSSLYVSRISSSGPTPDPDRIHGLPRRLSPSATSRSPDGETGEVWVAAIASGEIVRISSEGGVLSRNPNFDAPFDVRVDPGPRAEP